MGDQLNIIRPAESPNHTPEAIDVQFVVLHYTAVFRIGMHTRGILLKQGITRRAKKLATETLCFTSHERRFMTPINFGLAPWDS